MNIMNYVLLYYFKLLTSGLCDIYISEDYAPYYDRTFTIQISHKSLSKQNSYGIARVVDLLRLL